MWAAGTIVAELYNLVPLFPGKSEAETLALIHAVLGPFGKWKEGLKLIAKLGLKLEVSFLGLCQRKERKLKKENI